MRGENGRKLILHYWSHTHTHTHTHTHYLFLLVFFCVAGVFTAPQPLGVPNADEGAKDTPGLVAPGVAPGVAYAGKAWKGAGVAGAPNPPNAGGAAGAGVGANQDAAAGPGAVVSHTGIRAL